MPVPDLRAELEQSYPPRAAGLLERFYGNSKGCRDQKMCFTMSPEEDKTKPLTYKMKVHLWVPDPPTFPKWPSGLGKAKVSYHTEAEDFFDYDEPTSFLDTDANRVILEHNIDKIRWEEWFLIEIEFEYNTVKAIVESLESTYTSIPEEMKHEHIERMRRTHFFTRLKRNPDVGVNGYDGSIYGQTTPNDDWPLDQTMEQDESESPNGVNGVNGHR